MAERSDRKLILDRIERNLTSIDNIRRRLNEIIGLMQDASQEQGAYVDYESKVALVLTVTDQFQEVMEKLQSEF